jgi:hypothetical protein
MLSCTEVSKNTLTKVFPSSVSNKWWKVKVVPVPYHTMKEFRGNEGKAPQILNFGSSCSGQLYTQPFYTWK